ncbi:MAG: hypothetical protein K1X55_08780 [Chitinophagales bacterium]|nr:hypothetical protein [Chitinophagales bacterium]
MEWKIHNIYGGIHLVSASLAIVSTWFIYAWKKGTVQHKRVGYFFVINMLILNISSFGVMMQNNGKLGPFHILTMVSLVSLIRGMIPVIRRKDKDWLRKHYYGINGAVIGLYAAFFVEATFRTLKNPVAIIVLTIGLSTAVAIIGSIMMRRYSGRFFKK